MDEAQVLKVAAQNLAQAQRYVERALQLCYAQAPGWAGEVESCKEAIQETIQNFTEATE